MKPSSPYRPRVGDVLLADRIHSTRGKMTIEDEETRIVCVFLGTTIREEDPDVPDRLRKMGWTRNVVFEVTLQFGDGIQSWVHRLNYTSDQPREAALAAVRFAKRMLAEEQASVSEDDGDVELMSIIVRSMRLGEIDDEGTPTNGRGPAFVTWGVQSGESLDDLVDKIKNS